MNSVDLKNKAHTLIDSLVDGNALLEAVNYLKSLKEDSDWWDTITIEQKSAIESGLNDLKIGNTYTDEEVRSGIRDKLLSQKNK